MIEKVMIVCIECILNLNLLKYNLGIMLLVGVVVNFLMKEFFENFLLVCCLFVVENVIGVFIGVDFIIVIKVEDVEWVEINVGVVLVFEDFFEFGDKVVEGFVEVEEVKEIGEGIVDFEFINKIKEFIDEKVCLVVV